MQAEETARLEKLGFERPRETKVKSYIGYVTRQFRPRPKNYHANWKVMIILSQRLCKIHLCDCTPLNRLPSAVLLKQYRLIKDSLEESML